MQPLSRFTRCRSILVPWVVMFATTAPSQAGPQPKLPPIYSTTIDGNKQITEALVVAQRENKRVLLQFGANWCVWCHRLHEVFKTNEPIAKTLAFEYEWVLMDVEEVNGKRHNEDVVERYGNPTKHGLPVIVLLDSDGKPLATQETSSWEVGEGYDTSQVASFLDQWKPKPVSAERTLAEAMSAARSADKRLFVYFAAPWCGFCHHLTALMFDGQTGPVLQSAYVPVMIDIERMTGGKELAEKYGRKEDDGLPFWVILDTAGKTLTDSRGEKGNVGFPVEPFEVAHFMKVIRSTAPKLTPPQREALETALKKPDQAG